MNNKAHLLVPLVVGMIHDCCFPKVDFGVEFTVNVQVEDSIKYVEIAFSGLASVKRNVYDSLRRVIS